MAVGMFPRYTTPRIDDGGAFCRSPSSCPAHGSSATVPAAAPACAAAGFQPSYRIQTHDYASAIMLVLAGMGISVMPSLGTRILPDGVMARRVVHPTPVRSIGVLVLEEAADQPVIQRALALTRKASSVS